MAPIYVVREAIECDLAEISELLRIRHFRFMKNLAFSLILSNWMSIIKYIGFGLFTCYYTGFIFPIFSALLIVPVFILIEISYSTVVTRHSMKSTYQSIEKRTIEGNTANHQIWVVRRVGALAGVMSLRDSVGNTICLECEFFFCHEKAETARNFVFLQTLKTAIKIAETQKFTLLLFRCCDIFPEAVRMFESLEFELIMIHRVLILFSCIHMMTFAKVLTASEDMVRNAISVFIPGNVAPSVLSDDAGDPVTAAARDEPQPESVTTNEIGN